MRIQEFRGPTRPNGKNLRKTDSDSGFASHLAAPDDAAGATAMGGISALQSALVLQETGEQPDDHQTTRQHGNRLLGQLDRLRMDLLCGAITPGQLRQLQQTLDRERPAVIPPDMQEILGDIELRVRVELAKFGH